MRAILTAALLALPMPALAGEMTTRAYDGSFEDAVFSVESAIVGAGLKIDYHGYIGDMLTRTGADVGSDAVIFEDAEFFTFCSAALSREVMEADPGNIAYCPYTIHVMQRDGAVEVGFRTFPAGEMQKIQALLEGIVDAAME